jgi:hypothetical protein
LSSQWLPILEGDTKLEKQFTHACCLIATTDGESGVVNRRFPLESALEA